MAERDQHSDVGQEFQLPYQPGEFDDVANRLTRLVASLEQRHVTGLVPEELRFAAAALRRADMLLSPTAPADPVPEFPTEAPVSLATPAEPEPRAESSTGGLEIGQRGEWQGRVGRQPEFERLQSGRVRAVFYLAQHPDPDNRETTEWVRCYNLDRYAEALRKKGRLSGADVVVRGSFQGTRNLTRKDGTTVAQQTVYCYGVRVLKPAKDTPPSTPQDAHPAQPERPARKAQRREG